ncbi:hypothetical protein J6590_014526 [Homalodisca vitripennis]|nr:hypothetical protein J6590_014526 [Homalodisca vitripennis]
MGMLPRLSTDLPLQTQRRCGEWRAKTPHQRTRRDGLMHSAISGAGLDRSRANSALGSAGSRRNVSV